MSLVYSSHFCLDILRNRDVKGKKVMIPQFISRLFAYDQYLKAFY